MSIPNQWYYVKNNERCGPVDPVQLKQLADAGEIKRGSLVWRAGMADWVEAEQVKGLFTEPEQPGSPTLATTAQVTTPPQAASTAARPAEEEHREAPVEQEPVTQTTGEAEQPAPVKKISGEVHPVGMLLDVLHAKVTDSFVDASIQLFTKIGFWAILFYAMILLVGSLIEALQLQSLQHLGFEIGACILILVLQYPAIKMLELLGSWKFESKALKIPRPFFDTIALLAMLTGTGFLLFLTIESLKLGTYSTIFTSIAAFIVFLHLATATLSLSNQEESSAEENENDRSIADEAKVLFGGLLSIVLRTVPVVFGASISLSCLKLLYGMIGLRNAEDTCIFTVTAGHTALWTLAYLLLPATAYLVSVALRFLGSVLMGLAKR